ncbi:MAG: Gfo/Idh/MocA family oxidoreductase [Pseudomonadota bacterium]
MKIGCLGTARIADNALIKPAADLDGVTVVGIASRRLEKAEAFAAQHQIERAYSSYEAMLADPDIDLIYNPLPINLHAEWTIRALEAGKHVLCEKPFAMNRLEAEEMLATAERAGLRLIEAFHYRYHPGFIRLLELVRGGLIGEVKRVVARFTVPIKNTDGTEIRHLPETGGGAFMDLGCYPLHWARSAIGQEPETIYARADLTPLGVDETMMADLRFESGAAASLYASMSESQPFEARLYVEGTAGHFDFQNPLAPQLGSRLTFSREGIDEEISVSRETTFGAQLKAVVGAIADGSTLPTEGADTLAQQSALDEIYKAAGLADLRAGQTRPL